ncbi:Bgt-50939 [Blumeria graminis f. sp. tritici]|uniref:Bgt-50939 n=1 Tax=Blumeria graminis f. sp. tritici TaxID=62690 RepID=A0A9X9PRQ9_BLUGR|nr:Bgt-50939 [Blumeria graminis f. sp. tritici]
MRQQITGMSFAHQEVLYLKPSITDSNCSLPISEMDTP